MGIQKMRYTHNHDLIYDEMLYILHKTRLEPTLSTFILHEGGEWFGNKRRRPKFRKKVKYRHRREGKLSHWCYRSLRMEQIFLLLTLTMESIYLTNREKDTCDADHRLNKAIEYLDMNLS
jgi:hypothetical protein